MVAQRTVVKTALHRQMFDDTTMVSTTQPKLLSAFRLVSLGFLSRSKSWKLIGVISSMILLQVHAAVPATRDDQLIHKVMGHRRLVGSDPAPQNAFTTKVLEDNIMVENLSEQERLSAMLKLKIISREEYNTAKRVLEYDNARKDAHREKIAKKIASKKTNGIRKEKYDKQRRLNTSVRDLTDLTVTLDGTETEVMDGQFNTKKVPVHQAKTHWTKKILNANSKHPHYRATITGIRDGNESRHYKGRGVGSRVLIFYKGTELNCWVRTVRRHQQRQYLLKRDDSVMNAEGKYKFTHKSVNGHAIVVEFTLPTEC